MATAHFKLLAKIPDLLKAEESFKLEEGRKYLLGSSDNGENSLVFPYDRSLSRRQAWLELKGTTLYVQRHEKASQALNNDDSILTVQLQPGESFVAGVSQFEFCHIDEPETEGVPEHTFIFSTNEYRTSIRQPLTRSFLEAVNELPGLMKANDTPAAFLSALCRTLEKYVTGVAVTAWRVILSDDLPQLASLSATSAPPDRQSDNKEFRPSRHLVRQAFSLPDEQCAVSVWNRSGGLPPHLGLSVVVPGVEWAICIAITLAERERFALYATGTQMLNPGQQIEVQQLLAALGMLAKQHLVVAREKERRGQIGQFFSPALRNLLLDNVAGFDQALRPSIQEAAVCFFDLRGSSRLAEEHDVYAKPRGDAEQHFEFLGRILGEAASEVFATGGIVIDFQGDALLACWGVPPQGAPQQPQLQAARAAIQIVQRVYQSEWLSPDAASMLRCGVGLSSGKVLAGLFNARGHDATSLYKYAVIGRTVNRAARLEGLTKKIGVPVLFDETFVAALAGENFRHRRIARVRPVGMKDVVEVYELVLPAELGGTGVANSGITAYHAALTAFEQGNFSNADIALRQAPDDAIKSFLANHLSSLKDQPTVPEWDGAIALASK